MSAPLNLWIVRVLWLALPFTLLESVVDATSSAHDTTRLTTQALFWVLWAATFMVSLVPAPSTLTVQRMLVPLAPAASLCAAVVTAPGALGWAGLALGTIATVIDMSAPVGDWFVDGASYGDERRFALRPPAALLFGPLPVVWFLTVAPLLTAIMLIADGRYLFGVPLVLLGIATALWGGLASWRLARRWLVFVPAGVTLVDDMALAEPVLFARAKLRSVGPAHVDSTALDLSVGAPGLVIELAFTDPVEVVPAVGRDNVKDPRDVDSVLVVPSRPGTLLDHAESRSLPVARA